MYTNRQESWSIGGRVVSPLLEADHVRVEVERPVLVAHEKGRVNYLLQHQLFLRSDPHVVRYMFLFASHGRVLGNAGLASDFCFDRAGNEASFVCFVVRGPVFGVGWLLAGSESDC